MRPADQHPNRHQPWLQRFCYVALFFAALVLLMGGETTSNGAGMAFLTWPLSNGSLNPANWLHDLPMFCEHSHRLLAGVLSTVTIIAALWIQFTDTRPWVRRLGWILVGTILIQAVLGGLRVLLDQSNTHADTNTVAFCLRVAHAMTAEIAVLLWVTLTVALSRGWMVRGTGIHLVSPKVRSWGHITCAIIFLQIIFGAIMRHGGYAFAIPAQYFPFNGPDHALLPPEWTFPVLINFLHRVGAVFVTVALIGLANSVYRNADARRQLGSWMTLVLITVLFQIYLGTKVILTNKDANVATAHLLTGAFLLASTWLLTFISYRSKWWPADGIPQPSES